MPLTLAFDATGGRLAVGLFDGDQVLAEHAEQLERGHAERLFPLINDVLANAERAFSDLKVIAVCTGPGNFTGARIGVAAARGLALSTGAVAVGVDRFEALADGHTGALCVALTARGGAVHMARFENGVAVGAAQTVQPEEATEFAANTLIIGDGASAVIAATGCGTLDVETGDAPLHALARLAAAKAATGTQPRPAPRYLRPVNAALPREAPPQIIP